MSDFLVGMAAISRRRVRQAKARMGEAALLRRAAARPDAIALRLDATGFDILAEFKRCSPSRGPLLLHEPRRASVCAAAYARGGASAVSVVTEPTVFGGSLEALAETARGCPLPAMRKDFLVDPYQVIEARAYGASGVLLIARLLRGALLEEMLAAAASLRMFALVEVFDVDELERAIGTVEEASGAALLGVNARDLATLTIDATRHAALAHRAPAGVPLVAESGIATPDDAARVARAGYSAALVGEALMRSDDPAALLSSLIASGREAAAQREVTR